jgi:hypothetical protein
MSGYGSLGGGRGPHSLVDRIQDTIFALTSSLPCHGMSLREICTALPPGGASSSNSNTNNSLTSGNIKLNGRNVQVVKLLGEGGFSFVYLARDRESGREFALKKVSALHFTSKAYLFSLLFLTPLSSQDSMPCWFRSAAFGSG